MANRAQAEIGTIKWTNLQRVLEEAGEFFIKEARANLGANRSYASGTLGDTLEKIIEINDNAYSLKISLQDYWKYVENGRKPGKFPPPWAIQEWITVKPVKPYPLNNGKLPTIKQLSYLIGRKIAEEGIQPKPFFEPAKQATKERWQAAIDYAIEEDVKNYVEDLVVQQILYEGLFNAL